MDPQLVTSVLRRNGFLSDGEVASVQLEPMKANGIGSQMYRAVLTYSGTTSLPERMVVKRSLAGDRGQGEADAYERFWPGEACPAVMTCFGVVDPGPEEALHLFLEDLTETHTQTKWPINPKTSDCLGAVGALAEMHAVWWGQAGSIDPTDAPVVAHQEPEHLAQFMPQFADTVGDYLAGERLTRMERTLAEVGSKLRARSESSRVTVIHNDAHFWNFLYPRSDSGRCVMFDWPMWRPGIVGIDLAYMIALHLYPEHRRRVEPLLLERYAQSLEASGVDYPFAEIEQDYRLGIALGLLMPIMELSWGNPPITWLPKLEKAFGAFEDWDCEALFV